MDIHTTITILQLVITALASIAASSGFWVYLDRKRNNKDAGNKLLIGLAYVRIVDLSMTYIHRGYITRDEYDVLLKFLYQPYIELGGNGSVKRLMIEVDKLPIKNIPIYDMDRKDERNGSEQQSL